MNAPATSNEKILPTGRPSLALVGVGGWLDGQRFAIHGKTLLGRDNSCGITIPGHYLSRQHAELIPVGLTLEVKDLGSSNGTFIRGERVTSATLHSGDEIGFDTLRFRLEIGNGTATATTEPLQRVHKTEARDSQPDAVSSQAKPELSKLYAPPEPPPQLSSSLLPWIAIAVGSALLASVMLLFV